MRVVLLTTYHANRKEPLADLLDRVHRAFVESGLRDPLVHFAFSDAPCPDSPLPSAAP